MSYPKISIVTPSFNQGKFLEKTILSVLEQGYLNLEYIIIDGGSTDESVEIIKKYSDRLAYWVSEPDRGQSHAINKGFERATGEIFGWLNSDDWYHPGALQAVAEAFMANSDAGAVVGAGELVDEAGNVLITAARNEVTVETLYDWIDNFFWQPSCFFLKRVWDTCGPLDESVHFAMDLDLWIKIAQRFPFVSINKKLTYNLSHEEAKTTKDVHISIVDSAMVVLAHGGERPARKLLEKHIRKLLDEGKELARLYDEIGALMRFIEGKKLEIAIQNANLNEREQLLQGIYGSISWKITKPLRIIGEKVNHYCDKLRNN